MQSILDSINSLANAISSFFSVLPGGWGEMIAAAFILIFGYTVLKIVLDVIGTFF